MKEITRRNARVWSMLGMRRTIGNILEDMVELNSRFVFITADVARYFGTEKFEQEYPAHILDVGIAEQNLVGFASGMAKEGEKVFAATYATFITARTLDQIRVSLSYMKLDVKLIGVGGGLAEGDLSATHMGLEDFAVMRSLPNMTVICPADATEAVKVMYSLADFSGPVYVRLSGKENLPMVYTEDFHYSIGKANILRQGQDVAIIAVGTMVAVALETNELLKEKGINCTVIDMHTIKPLDKDAIGGVLEHKLIVTLEEHMRIGGLGSAVAEYISELKNKPQQLIIGVDDFYPDASEYNILLDECGLTANQICQKIEKVLAIEEN